MRHTDLRSPHISSYLRHISPISPHISRPGCGTRSSYHVSPYLPHISPISSSGVRPEGWRRVCRGRLRDGSETVPRRRRLGRVRRWRRRAAEARLGCRCLAPALRRRRFCRRPPFCPRVRRAAKQRMDASCDACCVRWRLPLRQQRDGGGAGDAAAAPTAAERHARALSLDARSRPPLHAVGCEQASTPSESSVG